MIVFICLCMVYLLMLVMRDQAMLLRAQLPEPKATYLVPDYRMLRGLVLGYNEAAADLVWVKALVYVGGESARIGKYEYLDSYARLIFSMDPMFRRAYRWAGVLSIYTARQITRRSVENAIKYLKMGVEKFPYDGDMLSMLGFDLYYELPPYLDSDKEKKKSRMEGLVYFKRAILSGNQPEWLVGLVSTLYTKNGRTDLAIQNLEENLKYIENPELRRQMLERLEKLKGERDLGAYVTEIQNLYAAWGRDFPYVPLDMYLLVGPRLSRAPFFAEGPSRADAAMDVLDGLSFER
jgi:hypothetical protein